MPVTKMKKTMLFLQKNIKEEPCIDEEQKDIYM